MANDVLAQIKTMPTSKLALIISNMELARKNAEYHDAAQKQLVRKTGNAAEAARRLEAGMAQLETAVKAEIQARAQGKGRG